MIQRPGWDEYFMGLARAASARGDCSRRQVGAVIVSGDHRIIATGYNGTAPGGPSCLAGQCPRAATDVAPGSSYDTGPGACIAIHAEANALLFARCDVRGSTLYVTHEPCDGCRKLISAAGVMVYESIDEGGGSDGEARVGVVTEIPGEPPCPLCEEYGGHTGQCWEVS